MGARAIAQRMASTVGMAIRLAASSAASTVTPAMAPSSTVWIAPRSSLENHPATGAGRGRPQTGDARTPGLDEKRLGAGGCGH
ncbi:MAG: hypothetical protein CVT94_10130 [Bacteroidetes bacterium HGW-Bacteroidetes-11]|nr:MAG: hypothetical protein CVT94_10130 [Bacteroidetes bacterium HGW-Bacteroidetes-11]